MRLPSVSIGAVGVRPGLMRRSDCLTVVRGGVVVSIMIVTVAVVLMSVGNMVHRGEALVRLMWRCLTP